IYALYPPSTFSVAPGDIGSRQAREKPNSRGDLLRFAVAPKRSRRRHRGRKVAVADRIHVGVDGAWLLIVDGNAFWSEITRPTARVSSDRALGCAVVADTRERGAVADHRANRDDAPALLHERSRGAHGGGGDTHIDCKEALKFGKVVGTIVNLTS